MRNRGAGRGVGGRCKSVTPVCSVVDFRFCWKGVIVACFRRRNPGETGDEGDHRHGIVERTSAAGFDRRTQQAGGLSRVRRALADTGKDARTQ